MVRYTVKPDEAAHNEQLVRTKLTQIGAYRLFGDA